MGFLFSCELLRRILGERWRGSRCAVTGPLGESLSSNSTSQPFCGCHSPLCNSYMHNVDGHEAAEKMQGQFKICYRFRNNVVFPLF